MGNSSVAYEPYAWWLARDDWAMPEKTLSATPDEMRRFGLKDCPMVHIDESGEIDCYFTETGATVVPGASHH